MDLMMERGGRAGYNKGDGQSPVPCLCLLLMVLAAAGCNQKFLTTETDFLQIEYNIAVGRRGSLAWLAY
jgi:hypothetical protein